MGVVDELARCASRPPVQRDGRDAPAVSRESWFDDRIQEFNEAMAEQEALANQIREKLGAVLSSDLEPMVNRNEIKCPTAACHLDERLMAVRVAMGVHTGQLRQLLDRISL